MQRTLLFTLLLTASLNASSQSPEITSWVINTNSATGYNNIPSNVQQVQYSANWVYVTCTCIPGYDIGPWVGNPNTPANQNFLFRITRAPQQNTGNLISTPLGHIGTWSNGVSIFNAKDAFSYGNQGIWNQNAIVVEGASFDTCLGHPAPNGEYHHHLHPKCLYNENDNTVHSPIIGYAFDGFPIYGAYAYANTNGTGGITRMKTSYRLRNISARTTLPDGTVLTSGQYGPAVNAFYPLGYYIEDYEYVPALGNLDEHNGRFCITPEYPSGTYAYFVTIDSLLQGEYPYTVGPEYYGLVPSGNTGPGSGHNIISEAVTVYSPTFIEGDGNDESQFTAYPNPAIDQLAVSNRQLAINTVEILNVEGTLVKSVKPSVQNAPLTISVHDLTPGIYFLHVTDNNMARTIQKIVVAR
jgi:hypothetical protein